MKVMVTGATGFVGRHVVAALLKRGHAVVAAARDETKARSFPWFAAVDFVSCDMNRSQDALVDSARGADAVAHLAWPGLPNYGSLFHFETNLPAAYGFLKAAVDAGVVHLLVTGTCFEYGMREGCLAEDTATDPVNPYGLAKDTLRRFLQAMQVVRPFTLQWARLFYMHGPGQNPASVLAQLDRAIDGGDAAFDMSGGEQLRDYLPVDEVASRLVGLLERPACTGIFNVCSGTPISIRDLVGQHISGRGARIAMNLGRYPYPKHEPMAFWGDARRIEAAIATPL